MSDLVALFLFVLVVGLIVVVGVGVGIIVAGRMDRLMAPRPPKRADGVADAAGPAPAEAINADTVNAAATPTEEQS